MINSLICHTKGLHGGGYAGNWMHYRMDALQTGEEKDQNLEASEESLGIVKLKENGHLVPTVI